MRHATLTSADMYCQASTASRPKQPLAFRGRGPFCSGEAPASGLPAHHLPGKPVTWGYTLLRFVVAALLCLGLGPASASAQGRLTGIVLERKSQAPLGNAEVQLLGTPFRAITGPDGRFTVAGVPAGQYTLRIVRIGHRPLTRTAVTVSDSGTADVALHMEKAALRLADIVVTPGHVGIGQQEVTPHQTLIPEDIEIVPQLGEDVFRAVKRLPGIASDDLSTKLNVRGGTDRELLVLLDGMELYEPYHLKDLDGALSIIDLEVVSGIDLITGGFGVEYGDKLTGVFNMRSRAPAGDRIRTSIGLSLTNLRFMSEGGFAGGKAQWLVSARRGYLDIALQVTGNGEKLSPRYYDAFAKVQFQPHPDHLVAGHLLHAADKYMFKDDGYGPNVTSGWGSTYGWVTWTAAFSPRIVAQTVASTGQVTRDRRGVAFFADNRQRLFVSDHRRFRFAGLKQDWSFELLNRMLIKTGFDAKALRSDYDYLNWMGWPRVDTLAVNVKPSGSAFGSFLAARVRPFDFATAEVGLRYDRHSYTGDADLSPRIHALFNLGSHTTLRTSWGRYYQSQGIHELDVAVGEREFFGSELAEQLAVGLDHRFDSGVNVRLEAYRRTISDPHPRYLDLERRTKAFPEIEADHIRVEPARGEAQGLEFLVKRDMGRRVAWSGSYVLSVARDEIGGTWVPRTLDQRHTLVANFAYKPNAKWRLSWSWQYHTGWPMTDTSYTVDALHRDYGEAPQFSALNSLRLPAYHRLDVRVSRNFDAGAGRIAVYLDVFNLYNRRNLRAFGYDRGFKVNGQQLADDLDGEGLLPLLPAFGLRWEF